MTTLKIEIHPDKAALVARSLTLVIETLEAAIAQRGIGSVALAGGSTPQPLYEALSQVSLPWDKVQVFWGDERYVPLDHPDSNAGMAKAAWLDHIAIPPENVHGVPTDLPQPEAAAIAYTATLQQVLGSDLAPFDLILLGMGDDGHTASLFPHTPALTVRDRGITVGHKGSEPRITFTAELINQSRCVMFLVAGANKQSALTQVFAEDAEDAAFPSRLIRPQGDLWWLLDAAAGVPLVNHPAAQSYSVEST